MQALKIRVDQIIDFGPTVAIIGADATSNLNVIVHIDYRPLQALQKEWSAAGLSERVKFAAEDLVMRLDLDGSAEPDGGLHQLPAKAA